MASAGSLLSDAALWIGAAYWVIAVVLLAVSCVATVLQPWLAERRAKIGRSRPYPSFCPSSSWKTIST